MVGPSLVTAACGVREPDAVASAADTLSGSQGGTDTVKLVFLGTRGSIKPVSGRHHRHTATMVEYRGGRVLIDCGDDWRGHVDELGPQAVVVTHAHPDHVGGLADGAPCPVYATETAWGSMRKLPVDDRRTVEARRPFVARGITFESFPVEHSIRAPAGGYRVSAGRVTIFYVPDVIDIEDRSEALSGCRLYVGDGAAVIRSLIHYPHGIRVGHSSVRRQLDWCREEGVPRMIVTHCGSAIVKSGDREAMERIGPLGEERGVEVAIAYDGMEVVLR